MYKYKLYADIFSLIQENSRTGPLFTFDFRKTETMKTEFIRPYMSVFDLKNLILNKYLKLPTGLIHVLIIHIF